MKNFHLGNPYDVTLIPTPGDGPQAYHDLLLGTTMIRVNEEPPEFKVRPGDTGKLGLPNPEYISDKRVAVASLYGPGWGYHDSAAYRNRTRKIRSDLTDYNEHPALIPRWGTQTPIATPNVLPVDYLRRRGK